MLDVFRKNSIELVEKEVSILQYSLATLNTSSLFVEEKYKLIEFIKEQYNRLDIANKKTINEWLHGRYKNEDVEVFKILIDKFAESKKGLFIIEKIPDNLHAGIFAKVYLGNQQNSILNISALQDRYYPSAKYEKITYQIPKELIEKFWRFINSSMKLRVIIQIVNGKLFVAGVRENFSKEPEFYSLKNFF